MKTSNKLLLYGLLWAALGILGAVTRTDSAYIPGIVILWVCIVGSELARLLENNKKENN